MKVTLVAFFLVCVHLSCAFDGDLVALLKLTDSEKREANLHMKECYAKENATQEDLAQLNEKSKCLLKCFYQTQGWFAKDGKILVEPVINAISTLNYKVAQICADMQTATNLCEKAYGDFTCYLKYYNPNE